jgi:hypothetical protein
MSMVVPRATVSGIYNVLLEILVPETKGGTTSEYVITPA